jgi:hypothetical protein
MFEKRVVSGEGRAEIDAFNSLPDFLSFLVGGRGLNLRPLPREGDQDDFGSN